MTIAAEFRTGQVSWSILWFFLFLLWSSLVVTVFGDIVRSDLSGWGKALWTIGIIAVPFFGVFFYLIANGGTPNRLAEPDAQAMADAQTADTRDVDGTGASPARQLGQLADLHTASKSPTTSTRQPRHRSSPAHDTLEVFDDAPPSSL